ncbi:hypothetical protein, partial [Helicobacter typhlonius]|uniref:hypothetical protein n=1 Tax=Helicobacter typhlonius TaxID=76936 RepID=UPI002FE16896
DDTALFKCGNVGRCRDREICFYYFLGIFYYYHLLLMIFYVSVVLGNWLCWGEVQISALIFLYEKKHLQIILYSLMYNKRDVRKFAFFWLI